MKNNAKPWERQPGETPKQYEAFCVYRDLKTISDPQSRRSLELAGQAMGKSKAALEPWSSKNKWVDRVAAWDEEQERIAREQAQKDQLKAISEMRTRHADLGKAMIMKAARALARIPEDEIRAGDISRMVDVAAKLERISRGDVGEVIEERPGEAVISPVTFYMPDNHRQEDDDEEE